MDDSKLRYFASAWLISITLPADSAGDATNLLI